LPPLQFSELDDDDNLSGSQPDDKFNNSSQVTQEILNLNNNMLTEGQREKLKDIIDMSQNVVEMTSMRSDLEEFANSYIEDRVGSELMASEVDADTNTSTLSSLRNLLRTIKRKLPSVQRDSPEEIAFVDVEITLSIRQEDEIKECQRALDQDMEQDPLKLEYYSSTSDDLIESNFDTDIQFKRSRCEVRQFFLQQFFHFSSTIQE
jgi:hypothetical protein